MAVKHAFTSAVSDGADTSLLRPADWNADHTLEDGTVTYAKIQDVSATDKLLGRSTAGSGDVEEIACTAAGRALIDDATAAAQLITLGVTSTAAELNALDGITSTVTELNYTDGVTSAIQTQLAAKEVSANKDATGGYAGLTLFKINFKNALNTIISFFTNANTVARTYTFQDRDGTIVDDTDLALKSPIASPTFTGTVTTPAIIVSSETASTIASFDASKNVKSLAVATYPSLTELSYVKGVTSAVQTQLNGKAASLGADDNYVTDAEKVVIGNTSGTNTGDASGHTGLQPLDSTLTSLAALGTAADKIAYTTAIDTWAETAITSAGRALIDDADATAQRVTLGLVIGTNVQAYDADLTTWAGITPAANIGTFLATPSSANLLAAVTDETGTGALVFANTPTLVTPVLGVASATSLACPTLTTASGAMGVTPAAGSNLNVTLSTTGDFAVNTSQFYIDTSAGNVGIGTASPGAKLDVNGSIKIPSDVSAGKLDIGGYSSYLARQATDGSTILQTGQAYLLLNPTGGNVGIGDPTPSYQLELSTDSAAKPSTTTWTVPSDERLKTNIMSADLERCWDIVKQLPLRHYRWKDDVYTIEQVKDRGKLGWIAQDVEKVFAKSVTTTEIKKFGGLEIKNCKGMNTDQIIAALYGTVQLMIQKIEKMEVDK